MGDRIKNAPGVVVWVKVRIDYGGGENEKGWRRGVKMWKVKTKSKLKASLGDTTLLVLDSLEPDNNLSP